MLLNCCLEMVFNTEHLGEDVKGTIAFHLTSPTICQ